MLRKTIIALVLIVVAIATVAIVASLGDGSGNTTATPAPSPAAASPTPDPAADELLKKAALSISAGVRRYAADNDGVYPPAEYVAEGGPVIQYMKRWPLDPITQATMNEGTNPGEFTYETDGGTYSVTVVLTDGSSYTVP